MISLCKSCIWQKVDQMGVTGCDLFAQDVKMFCLAMKSVARFVTRNLYGGERMIDFTEFVMQKFNELSEKFAKKNGQYAVSTEPLANFSTGARLKYGKAGMPEMYETLKDYCRKHVAYVETHGIDGKTLQDSLEDIAVYAVIALYMRACYEDECKVSNETDV